MKLWIVVQWGNKEEGPNGQDTQCIIRSNDMLKAVEFGESCMQPLKWKDGQADMIVLLGDDGMSDDGMMRTIIQPWINSAIYGGDYLSWRRHSITNEWMDTKTMYGD